MPSTPPPGIQGPLRYLVPGLVGLQTEDIQTMSHGEKREGLETGNRGGPALSLDSGHLPSRVWGREREAGLWFGISRLEWVLVL